MEERTILITENVGYSHLNEALLGGSTSIAAVLVRTGLLSGWPQGFDDFEIVSESSLYDHRKSSVAGALHRRFLDVYSSVVSDVRSLIIAERIWSSTVTVVEGAFKNASRLSILCWNALGLLERTGATRVVCTSTPHAISDWVVAKVAELLGIPVYIVGTSPVPWKAWCLRGLDSLQPMGIEELTPGQRHINGIPRDHSFEEGIAHYLRLNRSNQYLEAVPTIDRSSQELASNLSSQERHQRDHEMSLRERVKRMDPRRAAYRYLTHRRTTKEQRELLDRYHSLSRLPTFEAPTVSMFLHYQPERTSMPEGGAFSNQVAAAQAISVSLPAGWQLVVKEHPATFFGPGPYRRAFRDPKFYEAFDALPNVSLVPLERTPFELIDGSHTVVTITGTVGMQSLCRGVPVLALGAAAYRGAPGVSALPDNPSCQMEYLQRHFDAEGGQRQDVDQDALLEYLRTVDANSIGIFGEADEAPGSGEFAPTFASRVRATALLIP